MGGPITEFLMLSLSRCAQDSNQDQEWIKILNSNSEGLKASWSEYQNQNVKLHYRQLYDLLKRKNIQYIAMQYPRLDLKDIEKLFYSSINTPDIDESFKDIIFVSNKQNFDEALLKTNWQTIFKDRFSETFGHTTDYGHGLIAVSACQGVKKAMNKTNNPKIQIDCTP